MILGSIEIPNIKFQVGIVKIVLKINNFIRLKFNCFRHRPHRVLKREDMCGFPDRTPTRVLDPASEAGGQPGNITVSLASTARERGNYLLWSNQPCENVGQRQRDRVLALHHHQTLAGHHDHLQLPLSLPGQTDLWRGR